MTDACETMVIKSANGPVTINKSDFNPDIHKEHKETKKEAAAKVETAQIEQKTQEQNKVIENFNAGVIENKKRFYVVDQNNEGRMVTEIDGIDPKGYKSAKEAWDAVFTVRTQATGAVGVDGQIGPGTQHERSMNPSGETHGQGEQPGETE